MSKSSAVIESIPTVWPSERERIKKRNKELENMHIGDDSTDIWKQYWFDKYGQRHKDLENINLAQFVANYTSRPNGTYIKRKQSRVIRYRNYNMRDDSNEYKREMVTLCCLFRNKDMEILAESKYIEIYDTNEELILRRRQEFEANLDIQKVIEIDRTLCREDRSFEDDESHEDGNVLEELNPFEALYNNPGADMNNDLRLTVLNKLRRNEKT